MAGHQKGIDMAATGTKTQSKSRKKQGANRAAAKSDSKSNGKATSRKTNSGRATGTAKAGSATKAASKARGSKNTNDSRVSLPSSSDIGDLMKKARTPAAVAGAALVGAAGGMAWARNGQRKKRLKNINLPNVNLPRPDGSMIDWVEHTARAVGKGGYQVAELSAQARTLQKKISG